MARGSLYEFGVSAIHGYAGDLLLNTEVLILLATELTFPACPMHPGNANAVSELQMMDGCAFFHYAACDLMPEDQRLLGDGNDLRPIATGNM